MKIETRHGIVPMDADVLMIGVKPEHFDHFQRGVKAGFQSMNMGWSYVANLGESFDYVIKEFLPKRPKLDMVYITNEVGLSHGELQEGATRLADALSKHPATPWVVLGNDVMWLKSIFEARRDINVEHPSIVIGMSERHSQKCRIADRAMA